jgi:hypothetical protein
MGDMAEMALDRAFTEEYQLDEYVQGNYSMEEAFEHGFLDASGMEQEGVQAGWDRATIGPDEIENELKHAIKDFDLATQQLSATYAPKKVLNTEAVANLNKDCPTCNCCRESMTPRKGKFGKFYFCDNACKDQSTVSDKYWQSVKT